MVFQASKSNHWRLTLLNRFYWYVDGGMGDNIQVQYNIITISNSGDNLGANFGTPFYLKFGSEVEVSPDVGLPTGRFFASCHWPWSTAGDAWNSSHVWAKSRERCRRECPCLDDQRIVILSYKLIIEGSLEVKLPTIWKDEKHSQEETRTWRKSEGRR